MKKPQSIDLSSEVFRDKNSGGTRVFNSPSVWRVRTAVSRRKVAWQSDGVKGAFVVFLQSVVAAMLLPPSGGTEVPRRSTGRSRLLGVGELGGTARTRRCLATTRPLQCDLPRDHLEMFENVSDLLACVFRVIDGDMFALLRTDYGIFADILACIDCGVVGDDESFLRSVRGLD